MFPAQKKASNNNYYKNTIIVFLDLKIEIILLPGPAPSYVNPLIKIVFSFVA